MTSGGRVWWQISHKFLFVNENFIKKLKLNSVAWVLKLTMPAERQPLVGEVSAKFCGWRETRGQYDEFYGHILGFLDRNQNFITLFFVFLF
jgi:hypothetical protein